MERVKISVNKGRSAIKSFSRFGRREFFGILLKEVNHHGDGSVSSTVQKCT